MEDKRTALAVLLCMFVLMFWMEMVMAPYNRQNAQNATAPQQIAQAPAVNGQPQQVVISQTAQNIVPVAGASTRTAPTPSQIKESGVIKIQGPLYQTEISKLGGRIASFKLAQHKARMDNEALLDLVLISENDVLPLAVRVGSLNDDFVNYSLEKAEGQAALSGDSYVLNNSGTFTAVLSGQLNNAIKISKILTFSADSYLLKVSVKLSADTANGSSVWLEWDHFNPAAQTNDKLNHDYFAMLGIDNKDKLTQLKD